MMKIKYDFIKTIVYNIEYGHTKPRIPAAKTDDSSFT